MKALADRFRSLRPETQKRLVLFGVIALAFLLVLAVVYSRPSVKARPLGSHALLSREQEKVLGVNDSNEKVRMRRELDELKERLAAQSKSTAPQIDPFTRTLLGPVLPASVMGEGTPPQEGGAAKGSSVASAQKDAGADRFAAARPAPEVSSAPQRGGPTGGGPAGAARHDRDGFPMPPAPPGVMAREGRRAALPLPPAPAGPTASGGALAAPQLKIEANENPDAKRRPEEAKKKEVKEAPKREFYLPPSFMPGMLLTGLNAPTVEDGKSNPLPAMVRISAPAVLPNDVRRDLSGCFLIIECTGSLADERVHARVVSLSCLSLNGQAVIDEKVAGYLEDASGVEGIAGTVVTKQGALIARAMLAGLFQGIGEAARPATQASNLTSLGLVTQPGTSLRDIGVAGLGAGVAQAGRELEHFWMSMAKQAMPVIETLPAQQVKVIITKGTSIPIREFKGEEGGDHTKRKITW